MSALNALKLEPRLAALLEQEYPRFSEAEYDRRYRALAAVMEKAGVDHLLISTSNRNGNGTQWVTGWPGTVEALVIFKPGEKLVMHMEWFNHFPLAKVIAKTTDVRWSEHNGTAKTIEELKRRGARRVGVMGPVAVGKWKQFESQFEMVALDADYARLRMIKSQEEIDWLKLGAAFSDAGFKSLLAGTRAGMTERELGDLVERAYTPLGGSTMIRYIGTTPMAKPHIHVPRQYPSPRKVAAGDVVFCEISAFWWDYAGQVLRSFTVDAEPTPLYRDLHAAAEETFDAVTKVIRHGTSMEELLNASALVEQRGFTICDDLVHGFGGGYWQPIIGSKSRMAGPLPKMTLEENMCLVVQPNVTTTGPEEDRAGVQVGELIRVTRNGFELLHRMPRGFFRAGQQL